MVESALAAGSDNYAVRIVGVNQTQRVPGFVEGDGVDVGVSPNLPAFVVVQMHVGGNGFGGAG
jgi:hypothetical protein